MLRHFFGRRCCQKDIPPIPECPSKTLKHRWNQYVKYTIRTECTEFNCRNANLGGRDIGNFSLFSLGLYLANLVLDNYEFKLEFAENLQYIRLTVKTATALCRAYGIAKTT